MELPEYMFSEEGIEQMCDEIERQLEQHRIEEECRRMGSDNLEE